VTAKNPAAEQPMRERVAGVMDDAEWSSGDAIETLIVLLDECYEQVPGSELRERIMRATWSLDKPKPAPIPRRRVVDIPRAD
jgi:hypothetical protein